MTYSIENLDVYRKSINTSVHLYRVADELSGGDTGTLAGHLQQAALALVLNLADGLGFWEKEKKVSYFAAAKRAVLECLPLLEILTALNLIPSETKTRLAGELHDLARMISGLLRGAVRSEKGCPENGPGKGGGQVRERASAYH